MLPREARAQLYDVCAGLLLREVDARVLADLRSDTKAWAAIEPSLAAWLGTATDRDLSALRAEYARLFLLPRGLSPQASAWLDAEPGGDADRIATLTHHALDALSLSRGGEAGVLPLDHLGLILGLVADSLASPEARRAEIGEALERGALAPGGWMARFGQALEARTEAPLYRALGRVTASLGESLGT